VVAPGSTADPDHVAFHLGKLTAPTFDARGAGVFFYDGTGIVRYDVASGEVRTLFRATGTVGVSPDGQTVYAATFIGHVQRVLITNFADRPRP
jgi:hypothetical protein